MSAKFGDNMGRAMAVASTLKGGQFTAVTYPDSKARTISVRPQTCGKRNATELPFPLLWATGDPLAIAIDARIDFSGKQRVMTADPKKGKKWKTISAPKSSRVLKLATLRGYGTDIPPVSVLELLLTLEDIAAFASEEHADRIRAARPAGIDHAARVYRKNPLELKLGTMGGVDVYAVDSKNAAFRFDLDERLWVVPAGS